MSSIETQKKLIALINSLITKAYNCLFKTDAIQASHDNLITSASTYLKSAYEVVYFFDTAVKEYIKTHKNDQIVKSIKEKLEKLSTVKPEETRFRNINQIEINRKLEKVRRNARSLLRKLFG